jgi:hypothetical protein
VNVAAYLRTVSFLLVGTNMELYPGQETWSPYAVASLHAVHEIWLGGLELGPGPGDVRLSLGLRVSSRLVWTASYSGTAPSVGVLWRALGGELRVEETRHPLLGSITRVGWVVGGLDP